MDRLEFVGNIDKGNFVKLPDAIIQFFDHTMAAYNLVGQYSGINVSSSIDSSLCMTFNIMLQNENQAATIVNHILNDLHCTMDLYGKVFAINVNQNANNLKIQISQYA